MPTGVDTLSTRDDGCTNREMKRRDERRMYKGKDTCSTHAYNLITVSIVFAIVISAVERVDACPLLSVHFAMRGGIECRYFVNAGILVKIYQIRRLHTSNMCSRHAQTVSSWELDTLTLRSADVAQPWLTAEVHVCV